MKRLIALIAFCGLTAVGAQAANAPDGQLGRDNIRVYDYKSQPVLTCAPGVMCEIVLNKDEAIMPDPQGNGVISAGLDGWIVRPVQMEAPHIFVSPMEASTPKTTISIMTSKNRVYRIWLVAQATSGLNVIAFKGYPADPPPMLPPPTAQQQVSLAIAMATRRADALGGAGLGANTPLDDPGDTGLQGADFGSGSASHVDPTNLNFAYKITAKNNPPFRPTAVFNDGIREYIKLPDNAPVPSIVGADSRKIGFTYQDGYFVLGNLYDQITLAIGNGKDRTEVQIVKAH